MIERELHEGVGVGAGVVEGEGKPVPVVVLTFVNDRSALEDLEQGHYDPDDGRWHNFTLTVRAARQMIADLNEAIDQAIAGPPEESGQ